MRCFPQAKANFFLFLFLLIGQSVQAQFEKISIRNTSIEFEKDLIADTANSYVKLMLCGDILHRKEFMQKYANANNEYNYRTWFRQLKPLFFYPDFVVGNLKSFFPGRELMNNFQNSAPDEYAGEIAYTGFNVLMVGNRNALTDRDFINQKTKRTLNLLNIQTAGYYDDSAHKSINFPLVLEKKDVRIAFLSYTTDSVLLSLGADQINFLDMDSVHKDINKARKTMMADFVIAYIDWGVQDTNRLGKVAELINSGIDIVVGTSDFEAFTNADLLTFSDGSYKLHIENIGALNALSNERDRDKTAAIEIVIRKEKVSQRTSLHDMGFIPLWTLIDKERYAVLPISNIEEKHIKDVNLNFVQYSTMKVALTDLRYAFFDKIPELHYDFNDRIVQSVEQTGYIRRTLMHEQDKIGDTFKKLGRDEYVTMFGSAPPKTGTNFIPYEDDWNMYGKRAQKLTKSFDTTEIYGEVDEKLENGMIHIKANHTKYQREKLRELTREEKRERDSIRRYNERFMVYDSIGELKKLLKFKKKEEKRIRDSVFKARLDPNFRSTYTMPVERAPSMPAYKPEYRGSAFSSPNMTNSDNSSPVKNIEEYFCVEFLTSASGQAVDIEQYPFIFGYEVKKEGGFYHYYFGRTNTPALAIELCKSIRAKGLSNSIVVKFTNGARTVYKDNF